MHIILYTLIDETEDSCGGNVINNPVIPPVCTPQSNQADVTTTSGTSSQRDNMTHRIVISAVGAALLVSIILVLVIIIFVQRKKWKKTKQTLINSDDNTYSILAHNSKLVSWPIVDSFKNVPCVPLNS